MRIRTDGEYAYRKDVIEEAAEAWGCNKTEAVIRSCDVAARLVANVEEALENEDLPPALARELAETISTEQVGIEYVGPDVEVER